MSCSLIKKHTKKREYSCQKQETCGEAEEWREEEKQEKYAERRWQCESQLTWTLKSERRGGGGGARGTQSSAYTTVPAGKRRYFCLRLNPYTACCSETPFMFAAFHWTPLTFKGYAWSIERSKVDHGYTRESYSGGGKDQIICCVLEGREDRTEPTCCQKQVWPKKRKPSRPGGNMG